VRKKIVDRPTGEWKRTHVGAYSVAVIEVGLGEKDQAFSWLEKARDDRSFFLVNLKVEPELDSLRSDPRFAELVRNVGLPQ